MRLYKDVKYTVWQREYYNIDTESQAEAIHQILEGADPRYVEILHDTMEGLGEEEIYNSKNELVYQNDLSSKS